MKTDMELRQDVEKELARNLKVDEKNIAVAAKNGMVALAGRMQSYATKCEAESVVKHIVGVTGLPDEREVTLGGAQSDDIELTASVLQALEANVFVSSETITPIVHDGWVTLKSKAQYYHEKLDAEDAVRPLRGVKEITNSILIDNASEPQGLSQTIIAAALSRNARIDAHQVTVKVNGRTAILDGSVRSLAERDAAEITAWSAPGVNSVENHLVIRY